MAWGHSWYLSQRITHKLSPAVCWNVATVDNHWGSMIRIEGGLFSVVEWQFTYSRLVQTYGSTWLQNRHAIAAGVVIECEKQRGVTTNPIAYSGEEKWNNRYPVALVWQQPCMFWKNWFWLVQFFQWKFSFAQPGLLDYLKPFQRREYESYLNTVDGEFRNGRVVATKKRQGKMLARLERLSPTLGSGTLATGYFIPANILVPHRLYSLHTLTTLW